MRCISVSHQVLRIVQIAQVKCNIENAKICATVQKMQAISGWYVKAKLTEKQYSSISSGWALTKLKRIKNKLSSGNYATHACLIIIGKLLTIDNHIAIIICHWTCIIIRFMFNCNIYAITAQALRANAPIIEMVYAIFVTRDAIIHFG